MSSSVFFKFKSQKEATRVPFEGTGITVFELKREIITLSGLGDGTDFDLAIYDDQGQEYNDDTTFIPRSTTVTARRLPPSKPGQGRAARYVSGKAPVNAKNSYRTEASHNRTGSNARKSPPTDVNAEMAKAQTEEEKIAAMFKADANQWEQQQQQMAHAKPVYHRGQNNKKNVTVPDHEPPPGYICYRCHQKGHWIQACPTNDDPNFDNKPRVKRTTGIPRSFLQTVERPNPDEESDERPNGVMINADGEFVVAMPDTQSWEKYQAKTQAAAAQQEEAAVTDKEIKERGLACPIDGRLFVEPKKTPCCGKTYCFECIENALFNSDFVCPGCSTEGVLVDNLVDDDDSAKKIKEFEDELAARKKAKEQGKRESSGSPTAAVATPAPPAVKTESKSPLQANKAPVDRASSSTPTSQTSTTSKKRPAEEELKNDRIPTAPAAMRNKDSATPSAQPLQKPADMTNQDFIAQMNALAGGNGQQGLNGMNMMFPGMPGMMNMPGMGMNGMNPMMMNGMMSMPAMNGLGGMGGMGGMNPMMMGQMQQWGSGMGMMGNQGWNAYGANGMNMGMPNGGYNQWQGQQNQQYQNNQQQHNNWNQQRGLPHNNTMQSGHHAHNQPQGQQGQPGQQQGKMGVFPNQQKTVFSEPFPNEEDNAYFRKPVNPHRHQARNRRVRPSDYTEL